MRRRPSRLSQKTCAVVTPKVSAPRPVSGEAQDLRQHAREARDLVHRLHAVHAMDDADHVVVDQVGADAGQIVHDRDAERLQVRRRPDAGDLQDVRRVDGAARRR